jgi:hypothetical protein
MAVKIGEKVTIGKIEYIYTEQGTLEVVSSIDTNPVVTELEKKADVNEKQLVKNTILPLPIGASTSDKQDLLLTELEKKADLTETQPVASQNLTIDADTGNIVNIPHDHHEVHEGDAYIISDVQNVNSTTIQWQITTPDTVVEPHVEFNIDCTGEMYVVVTEGSDRVDGTPLLPINRNRRSIKTATVIASITPTGGTTDGTTTLRILRVGSTGMGSMTIASGGSRGINEFILKRNTKYIVSITTYADVFVSLGIDFYEHTPI